MINAGTLEPTQTPLDTTPALRSRHRRDTTPRTSRLDAKRGGRQRPRACRVPPGRAHGLACRARRHALASWRERGRSASHRRALSHRPGVQRPGHFGRAAAICRRSGVHASGRRVVRPRRQRDCTAVHTKRRTAPCSIRTYRHGECRRGMGDRPARANAPGKPYVRVGYGGRQRRRGGDARSRRRASFTRWARSDCHESSRKRWRQPR